METSKLKKFAQYARRSLIDQVSSKLEQVIKDESAARRELPQVVEKLNKELARLGEGERGKELLVERVAYVWFNRFCALRFMDANAYNRIGVLSPIEGQFQPEILAEAKAGHIDEDIVNNQTREKIFGLLNGSIKSRDGQVEAYHLLIVAVCNNYHRIMPYLFERIEGYTELLMPDDLLSGNSILAYTREAMTPEACESVECIGWLYQFYISEKKDQVFADLKKNKKITPENIPAATQLFTPHWIVRYLVENSLGRLWMLNNPSSKIIKQMDYYIKHVEIETDFLRVSNPEEIKICDPACGSGHMLTYAYDLLYAIYLDAGYDPTDIPELILTKNLYGIEIDERAAELAAFALSMKAIEGNPQDDSNNRRRFFRNPIKPNICRLEEIHFSDDTLQSIQTTLGKEVFSAHLLSQLNNFEEAGNLGSLITTDISDPENIKNALIDLKRRANLTIGHPEALPDEQIAKINTPTFKSILRVLDQADYLSQKYQVVVANPPYMGSGGMNGQLKVWAKENFPISKPDLFAMFVERSLDLATAMSYVAIINMQSWMFLSTYEKFRNSLFSIARFTSMAHLGERAFDSIGGAVVSTTAFVLEKAPTQGKEAVYIRLVDGKDEAEKASMLREAANSVDSSFRYMSTIEDFKKIPGSLIVYWLSDQFSNNFDICPKLGSIFTSREGLTTGSNDTFIRQWYEVSLDRSVFPRDTEKKGKWFSYLKGGDYRRWAGNNEHLVEWSNDGGRVLGFADEKTGRIRSHNYNGEWAGRAGITWSSVSGEAFSVRNVAGGYMFDTTGSMGFVEPDSDRLGVVAFLNSVVASSYMKVLSPAIRFQPGHSLNLPLQKNPFPKVSAIAERCVSLVQADWNAYETSWDFNSLPLLQKIGAQVSIKETYQDVRDGWMRKTVELKTLEENNNQIFIESYGLKSELSAKVSFHNVTLTCNPFYRYGHKYSEKELEIKLLSDSICEFVSYAVGCMLGRYSLDRKGLILANQGDTLENYLKQISVPSYMPDDDNVIPLIDFEGDWFEDDISERFKQFLRVTFGEEIFSENLAFIEKAIGKDIKKYFVKDFYIDHVKRYKKRPIYWMFSSPKGSFNVLIYMHRYRPDTVSVILNDYLREFRTKLIARKESYEQVEISVSASPKEKTQAIKSVAKINKVIDEVNDYERDILYPLAGKNIEIDLDDGVKHNYPLFGKALKKVTGLS